MTGDQSIPITGDTSVVEEVGRKYTDGGTFNLNYYIFGHNYCCPIR